jgi:uncharacterized ion transporter superfamily protein YfcC
VYIYIHIYVHLYIYFYIYTIVDDESIISQSQSQSQKIRQDRQDRQDEFEMNRKKGVFYVIIGMFILNISTKGSISVYETLGAQIGLIDYHLSTNQLGALISGMCVYFYYSVYVIC